MRRAYADSVAVMGVARVTRHKRVKDQRVYLVGRRMGRRYYSFDAGVTWHEAYGTALRAQERVEGVRW